MRSHLNRPCQIAFGNGRRHIGDRPQLRGEITGQLIDVVRQIAPGAGCAWNICLPSELSFHTHFAGHSRDLISESGERVGHAIDRVRQGGDLAFGFDQ